MDIVLWLRSLGLGKYEAAFRENEIDETVLPSLTHETLKELGVTAVGHRLKLLDCCDAKLLQVLLRQPWKNRLVNLVLAERSLILSKAKAPQPRHDIRWGRPYSGLLIGVLVE